MLPYVTSTLYVPLLAFGILEYCALTLSLSLKPVALVPVTFVAPNIEVLLLLAIPLIVTDLPNGLYKEIVKAFHIVKFGVLVQCG